MNRLGCWTALIVFVPLVAQGASYTIVGIGTNNASTSAGFGINESGQVAGRDAQQVQGTAFVYDGSVHDLGTLGGNNSWAQAINDQGWVAGFSKLPFAPPFAVDHAFLFDGTTMHDLGHLGGDISYAYSLNNNGHVVGQSAIPTVPDENGSTQYIYHAFLYDGVMHDLGTLGSPQSTAWDINSSGIVVGESGASGFYYDGSMHDIGDLGGGSARASAVNDQGHIVGNSRLVDDPADHLFLYDGVMHDLGTFDDDSIFASDVNELGQIVGHAQNFAVPSLRAFLYDSSHGIRDLNTLIDPDTGWVLTMALGINDRGQITGLGMYDGQELGFILTPVPEPSTILLACCGGAMALLASLRIKRPCPRS